MWLGGGQNFCAQEQYNRFDRRGGDFKGDKAIEDGESLGGHEVGLHSKAWLSMSGHARLRGKSGGGGEGILDSAVPISRVWGSRMNNTRRRTN